MFNIEILEISKKEIYSEWPSILNGLALIPSQKFRVFNLTTDTIKPEIVESLAGALKLLK